MAVSYAKAIYKKTDTFPGQEQYSLASQLRRAVISIESALETTSELALACELGYLTTEEKTVLYNQAEVLIKIIHCFKQILASKP